MTVEVGREEPLAVRARRGIVHRPEARALPRRGIALDDERAAVGRVAIVMGDERAVFAFAEREREAIERLGRAVPDELVGEPLDPRTERVRAQRAQARVDAVGRDHEIESRETVEGLDRGAEREAHAGIGAFLLEQPQQCEAADRAEAVAVDVDRRVAMDDALHRPRLHDARERGVHGGRVAREEFERAVREHDAEPEGRVRGVLLEDADVRFRPPSLGEQREQKPRGACAGDGDPHYPDTLRPRPLRAGAAAGPRRLASASTTGLR